MSLNPRFVLGDIDLTQAPYAFEFGSDFGDPTNVVQVIDSLLADGQIERVVGAQNRTLSVAVLLEASDMAALADAEAALALECAKPLNSFTVDPGDGFGKPTLFQVFAGQLVFTRDDETEINGFRRYRLTMRALPFGFSEDEIVDTAAVGAPASPSTTVISDGTSATGWSSPDGTVTVVSGALSVPTHLQAPFTTSQGVDFRLHEADATYTFGAPLNFTATPFVTADLYMAGTRSLDARLEVPGSSLAPFSEVAQPDGSVRFSWKVTGTSVATIKVVGFAVSETPAGTTAPTISLRLDNVSRSNVGPAASSTGRESQRLIEVTGSARTAASVAVEHATLGLGDVILYTSSALATGYTPALRAFQVGSTGNAGSSSSVSGTITTTSSPIVFEVPAASMPVGPHLLMMRVTAGVPATSVTVSTIIGSTIVNTQSITPPTAGVTGNVALGVVTMPTVDLPATSTATIRITINGLTGSFALDELWSFYLGGDSDLTQVACGTGTPVVGGVANRLFIDSPSIANGGVPALYIGTTADRSDAYRPPVTSISSWGRHQFAPPTMRLFLVASGGANPTLTLRHRPAWFTHAGK